jgi:hypothetical protein
MYGIHDAAHADSHTRILQIVTKLANSTIYDILFE